MEIKENLLLHSCCAPCSTVAIERLGSDYNLFVYYYNPNIFPKDEYEKRKIEQIEFIHNFNRNNNLHVEFINGDYESQAFDKIITGYEDEPEMGKRCIKCIELRIQNTADKAKILGIGNIATTLSISPYKNTIMINDIGRRIAESSNMIFMENDFKENEGYKKSIEISKNYGLYRQKYCGCKYSIR